jgi:molecular chaperone IbpA
MVIKTNTGFGLDIDKLFNSMVNGTTQPSYPPYNVIKVDDDEFWLEFAVAGFSKEEIKVTTKDGKLTISGERQDNPLPDGGVYVHKGIASRKFTRTFSLPQYFEVVNVTMEDGILYINLLEDVPEEKKPKEFEIK